jgi:uncharacterized protein YgfB (UPF0149 family)
VIISFDAVSDLLHRLGVPVGASEAHGIVVGLLCAQPSTVAKPRWFTEILDAAGVEAGELKSSAADVHALDAFFNQSVESLNDPDLGFVPLLPEDNVALAQQLTALSDFCAGFNYGIGIGTGGRGGQTLPKDTAEILTDFQGIESAELDESGEPDENSFVELAEYVRVGVLLIHEELQPIGPTGQQVH